MIILGCTGGDEAVGARSVLARVLAFPPVFLFVLFAAPNGDVQNFPHHHYKHHHHHHHKDVRTAAVQDQNHLEYYQDSDNRCCARFSLWACFGWNGEDEVKRFVGVSSLVLVLFPFSRPSVVVHGCSGLRRVSAVCPPCWRLSPPLPSNAPHRSSSA